MAAKTDRRVSNRSTKRSVRQQILDQHNFGDSSSAQVSDVNNQLRSEQLHSYHEQQGMAELGSTYNGRDLLGPPPPQEVGQFGIPYHFDEKYAQLSRDNTAASNEADSAQLDAMLKPYKQLMGSSDVHPAQRFLAPGAPQDPTYHSKTALDELGTPLADGSSNENRARIAELNYLDATRNRERHRRSSSNGFDFARY